VTLAGAPSPQGTPPFPLTRHAPTTQTPWKLLLSRRRASTLALPNRSTDGPHTALSASSLQPWLRATHHAPPATALATYLCPLSPQLTRRAAPTTQTPWQLLLSLPRACPYPVLLILPFPLCTPPYFLSQSSADSVFRLELPPTLRLRCCCYCCRCCCRRRCRC
jgi:hypothetical protein